MLNEPAVNRTASEKRPWIKICGLTDPENAFACAELGPDAIGLVFYEKSPRYVSIDQAVQITRILPRHLMTIGVFVDNSFEDIMEKAQRCSLKGVQLHGKESPELVDQLKKEHLFVIKALFTAKEPYLSRAKEYSAASALLVEYGKGVLPGGNAESWNYELSSRIDTKCPIIIASGLSPMNAAEAVMAGRPFGVDVSSGVEKTPGLKDIDKINAFIARERIPDRFIHKA